MTTMAQAPLMISLTEEERKIQQEASELTEAVVKYHVPDSHRKPLEGLLKVWKKENPNIDGESLDFAEQIIYTSYLRQNDAYLRCTPLVPLLTEAKYT